MVCWPIVADEASAVQNEPHGQLLNGAIMDDLVISSLKESGVDGAERLQPLSSLSRSKSDCVLLSDADVKRTFRESPAEFVDARTSRHRSGNCDNTTIGGCYLDQRFGKDGGVRRCLRRGGEFLARRDVELGHTMVFVGRRLGWGIAITLFSLDVQEDRLVATAVTNILEDWDKIVEVVAVHGANIIEPKLLEQRATRHHAASVLIDLRISLLDLARKESVNGFCGVPKVFKRF
mmetsp:Transcript_46006/g.103660  ORF Transcript_46006/g.103660 Transcript_46006/m.103660 type:complete len:234 (+) Transcript_46006:1085-1786(+)